MSRSSNQTLPRVGVSSMFTHRSRVDLPEPEGPRIETTSPSRASSEMPFRTSSEPKVLRRLVAEHDLIVTGSSDYHGTGKPNVPGEFTTSDDMVARIIARATGSAPVYP